jgi:hypothetical protein
MLHTIKRKRKGVGGDQGGESIGGGGMGILETIIPSNNLMSSSREFF